MATLAPVAFLSVRAVASATFEDHLAMRSPKSPRRVRVLSPANAPLFSELLEPRVLLSASIKPGTRSGGDLSITLGQYHTYTSATTDLQSFASMYPNITRL